MTFYKAKAIILDDLVLEGGYLGVEGGKITSIVQEEPAGEWVDYSAYVLAPGYVDTHIHGYAGHDVMDGDGEGLEAISRALLQCGVTSWEPTTLTAAPDEISKVCAIIRQARPSLSGARVQGIFLEGPFFSPDYKGAQNARYMIDPDIRLLESWQEAAGGLINKLALAPERRGSLDFIPQAGRLGVRISLGHSAASYEEGLAAVKAGASLINHTYNAMTPLHHRRPGLVGLALSQPNLYTEIIADGHHVHPAAIQVLLRARRQDEVVLVTDCMRAGGLGSGPSRLGEFDVVVEDGAARLAGSSQLAGSILELKTAVSNLVAWGLTDLATAVRMASLNPARSLGIDDRCGSLKPGRKADFLVLEEDGRLVHTYLDGVMRC